MSRYPNSVNNDLPAVFTEFFCIHPEQHEILRSHHSRLALTTRYIVKCAVAADKREFLMPANAFDHVDIWIFDLDNTLYPAHCNLFAQVDTRMGEFISDFLGVDRTEARQIQKKYYHEYGTTLSGLMRCHNMAPEPFLDYVHDIDVTPVDPDQMLNETLARLQGTKYVFTNGSVRHAENVLGRLGIQHHFSDIFDIVAADYIPKPEPDTYSRFLEATGIEPRKSAMFEDIARNLEHPHAIGMTTVLVHSPEDKRHQHSNEWDGVGADEPHVHHVTDDLASFLAPLAA